jgi:hypothetical protein
MGVWYYPVGRSYGTIYKAQWEYARECIVLQDITYKGKAVPQHATKAYGIVEV